MKKTYFILFYFFLCNDISVKAQTKEQYSGWLTLFHTQSITSKTSINIDFHLRSQNQFDGLKTSIIRSSFIYNVTPNFNTGLGYSFINTKSPVANVENPLLTEHAIWEQISLNCKLHGINLLSRIRLEQRFIEQQSAHVFSQRLRFFSRFQIPLNQNKKEKFASGTYLIAQEEAFFNVQNKAQLNTYLFDQNRALLGIGYRFNPKLDIEMGYLNQFIKGKTGNINNHIFQVTAFTRFKKK